MPPRRPGGKYKGAVSRFKGEATLEKEFQDGRSRMLQKYIKEQEEKKRTAMAGEYVAKFRMESHNKDLQVKVVSFMIGSRTDLLKGAWKLWIDGRNAVWKEKAVQKRDLAWRASCTCVDTQGGRCEVHHALTDVGFRMPFDLARDAARRREEELKVLEAEKKRRPLHLLALPTSPQERISRAASDTTLPGHVHKSVWPCHCRVCFDPSTVDPNFMDITKAKPSVHYRTGRRVLLDENTMRFCMFDATRVHSMSSSSIV